MAARTGGAEFPAPASSPEHGSTPRLVLVVATVGSRFMLPVFLTVMAIVVLLAGFEVAIRLVPPDAVQVTVSAAADGRTLASHAISDPRAVADLSARINRLPSAELFGSYGCTLASPDAETIDFRFTRWGLPIEDAVLPRLGCSEWWVSRGGIPDPRVDHNGETQAIQSEVPTLLSVP